MKKINEIKNYRLMRDEPRIHYSTRDKKRKQQISLQMFLSEPSSFAEAQERGLSYYWDSGE